MVAFSALSLAPDLDVIAFRFGIPYAAPFGHRGAAHSISVALVLSAVAALATRLTSDQVDGGQTRLRLWLLCATVAVMRKMADGIDFKTPATIEDPAALEESRRRAGSFARLGYPRKTV
jgi:hypothetical protein